MGKRLEWIRHKKVTQVTAAAAKSLQSCPTLCDPRDSRDPPGKNTGVACHFLLQCMKVKSESEVSQSSPTQRPHGLQPTWLLYPWDFPGRSTGVGCHCLLRPRWLLNTKKLSTSLDIRKIQTKITIKQRAEIKRQTWVIMQNKETPKDCWWESKLTELYFF